MLNSIHDDNSQIITLLIDKSPFKNTEFKLRSFRNNIVSAFNKTFIKTQSQFNFVMDKIDMFSLEATIQRLRLENNN
jgi:hypothetical protein